ncbi:MAG TPA: SDR family NAD(P)-dependent oxidoreductase [Candidatus Nocardiopsis merdipullorum]|nr:SDR family NAD(P)-dependent oxidoreductase [Candidatus Nocardiopsis merdipullorum]
MSEKSVTIPNLGGRTAVITGANSGLGLETARTLGRAGAKVVLAVRNEEKGREAAGSVPGMAEVRRLDLADLSSVRAFADGWKGDIHLLINNAGVMAVPAGRTVDGFETQFGVNHLGHFALTNLLLQHVTGRVVTVSSQMHRLARDVHSEDVGLEHGYSPYRAYARSKLANLLFTLELQRRLEQVGSDVLSVASHPGYAATNLQSHGADPFTRKVALLANKVVAQSAWVGSLPTVFAATQDIDGAGYAGPGRMFGVRGAPTYAKRSAAAKDTEVARRLWEMSEEMTRVSFPL